MATNADKIEVDKNEQVVLNNHLNQKSKKKRQELDSGSGKVNDSVSSISSVGIKQEFSFESMCSSMQNMTQAYLVEASRSNVAFSNTNLENEVEAAFQNSEINTVAALQNMIGMVTFQNDHEIVDMLGLLGVFSIFCTEGKNFDGDYIKSEFEKLGMSKMFSLKLYMILKDMKSEYLKRKNAVSSAVSI